MLPANSDPFFNVRGRKMLTCFNKMFDLVEYPWITNGGTSDHNSIYSIPVFILNCFFRRINIAISKNGNGDPWIVFYFTDQRPVGFTFIHLYSSTPVNS